MKTPKTFVLYFHLLFQKGNTDIHVYRAEVTFLITIGEMDFFSLVLLFCAAFAYCVIYVSKGSNK